MAMVVSMVFPPAIYRKCALLGLLITLLFLVGCQEILPPIDDLNPPVTNPDPGSDPDPEPNPIQPTIPSSDSVHIFYYPWYGNPDFDLGKPNISSSGWRHWQQALKEDEPLPENIGASCYPSLGAYSSSNQQVLDQHMRWIKDAGIGVIVMSWWGRDSWEDQHTLQILDSADAHGLKTAFLLEPYKESSVPKLKDDISYIYSNYGSHPAFYRVTRPTKYGPSTEARGVFYVFNVGPISSFSKWRSILESIRGTADDAIVLSLGSTSNPIEEGHFDGIYTYGVHGVGQDPFTGFAKRSEASNGIFAPSVGPGYDETRAVPSTHRFTSRDKGAYYDRLWQAAIASGSEWITITSFNEWHEGTQIEPAIPKSTEKYIYDDYESAYGLSGNTAEFAYLTRTHYWVNKFMVVSSGGEFSYNKETKPIVVDTDVLLNKKIKSFFVESLPFLPPQSFVKQTALSSIHWLSHLY